MRRNFTRVIVLLVLGLLVNYLCLGCPSVAPNARSVQPSGQTVDYGNGVFYFAFTDDQFGNGLSDFVKNNPNWHIVSVCGNVQGVYTHSPEGMGYWVICTESE